LIPARYTAITTPLPSNTYGMRICFCKIALSLVVISHFYQTYFTLICYNSIRSSSKPRCTVQVITRRVTCLYERYGTSVIGRWEKRCCLAPSPYPRGRLLGSCRFWTTHHSQQATCQRDSSIAPRTLSSTAQEVKIGTVRRFLRRAAPRTFTSAYSKGFR
jgi:hypothetical protein